MLRAFFAMAMIVASGVDIALRGGWFSQVLPAATAEPTGFRSGYAVAADPIGGTGGLGPVP